MQSNYKMIINADDFGITKGVNKAIVELAEAGILTSTAVMTNMPFYKEIKSLENRIGIGIHLTLTEGMPVSDTKEISSLVNSEGTFYGLTELISQVKQGRIDQLEARRELDAQIKRLVDLGIRPDHINSHESFLKYPFFCSLVKDLARQHGINAVRTFAQRKFDYSRLLNPKRTLISLYLLYQKMLYNKNGFSVVDRHDTLLKINLDYETACSKLRDVIDNMPSGVLELVVHPGYIDEDKSYLGDYVHEREVETTVLLAHAEEVKSNPNIQLIRFSDL